MLNFKLTAKIRKIKARDDDFTKEAQKILTIVSNITVRLKKACHNNFGRIETDQLSVASQSETSSQSHASSSGSQTGINIPFNL
jgi:hypothetical protein